MHQDEIVLVLRARATTWETRAAMGTAETPADPISGLIFSFRKRFMTLASRRPPTVLKEKATRPSTKMNREVGGGRQQLENREKNPQSLRDP